MYDKDNGETGLVSEQREYYVRMSHFLGDYCEKNIDDCATAPCLNDGRCVDRVDDYRCVCQPEYVGVNCSRHVCDEDTSPCVNGGSCHVVDNEARCLCPPAFSGDVCEHDKCLDVTCLNDGTCVTGICLCQQGKYEQTPYVT